MMHRISAAAALALAVTACLHASPEAELPRRSAEALVDRPLATRAALTDLERRLSGEPVADGADSATALTRARARLEMGDFRQGDLVLIEAQGEPALTDTFAVGPDRQLTLPSPTVGSVSLEGVLRSELQAVVERHIARFVVNPVVRAQPLLRLSIQGEVVNAGFHGVPADAVLAEALMAAGGTTPQADMEDARIKREDDSLLEGQGLRRAISAGYTLDQLYLRDGDEIIIARRGDESFMERLRFMWVIISITGGIYGLSRAF